MIKDMTYFYQWKKKYLRQFITNSLFKLKN